MPFGVKPDGHGGSVDFDAVYEELLAPAIRDAELEPLRADQELVGGLIHKPMFERLILADYAVADLTTANANVFYELGVRHAVAALLDRARLRRRQARRRSTSRPIACCRTRSTATAARRTPTSDRDGAGRGAARGARAATTDSPVFQLIDDLPAPQIDRLKTDVFRDQAAYSAERQGAARGGARRGRRRGARGRARARAARGRRGRRAGRPAPLLPRRQGAGTR